MGKLFYSVISVFGPAVTAFFAALISAAYFFLLPRRTAIGVRFYKALFPNRRLWFYLWLTWRQYQGFARTFSERLLLNRRGKSALKVQALGREYLEQAAASGEGGVILMSHAGSWEVAARTLKRTGIDMMLFMGRKAREQAEGVQKKDIQSEGFALKVTAENDSSPLDILDGLRFLKQGGFVSMAGDRVWRAERTVSVQFLGRPVRIPATPYLMAAIARVPGFVFFSVRIGRHSYRVECHPPIRLEYDSRQHRQAAIQQAAQAYADKLQGFVEKFPCQWYHFEPFLENQSD